MSILNISGIKICRNEHNGSFYGHTLDHSDMKHSSAMPPPMGIYQFKDRS